MGGGGSQEMPPDLGPREQGCPSRRAATRFILLLVQVGAVQLGIVVEQPGSRRLAGLPAAGVVMGGRWTGEVHLDLGPREQSCPTRKAAIHLFSCRWGLCLQGPLMQ